MGHEWQASSSLPLHHLPEGWPSPATQATFFCGVASPRVQVSLATGLQSGGEPTADCIEIPGAPGDSPPAAPQWPLSPDSQAFSGGLQKNASLSTEDHLLPQRDAPAYTGLPSSPFSLDYASLEGPRGSCRGVWASPGLEPGHSVLGEKLTCFSLRGHMEQSTATQGSAGQGARPTWSAPLRR